MGRNIKKLAIVAAFVLTLSVFGIMVYAYDNEATSTLYGVTIKGKNYISSDRKSSSSTSWTSSMNADVTVNAVFYWYDFASQNFGTTNLAGGGSGSWTVSVPYIHTRQYYKVISDHDFWVSDHHSGFDDFTLDISENP